MNGQMQDKVRILLARSTDVYKFLVQEKRYFDLYQEKMMLEETLIRENATSKLQNRNSIAGKPAVMSGPPATFVNPVSTSRSTLVGENNSSDVKRENMVADFQQEMLAMDGLGEANFDVVPSPGRRTNTQYISGSG